MSASMRRNSFIMRAMRITACVGLVSGAVGHTRAQGVDTKWGEGRPEALQRFEDARAMIAAELRVRRYTPEWGVFQTRSTVNGDYVAFYLDGTEDGVTGTNTEGEPVRFPVSRLRTPDGYWEKYRRALSAQAELAERAYEGRVLDYRSLGMVARPAALMMSPTTTIAGNLQRSGSGGAIEYRESVDDDGLHIVEARIRDDKRTFKWQLDPALNWNAVEVEEWLGEELAIRVVLDYEWINGVCVPVKAVYADGRDNVLGSTEVEYLKVNTPDIPEVLTPEDIGIWSGMPVRLEGAPEQMMWSEHGLVTFTQWRELRQQGLVTRDPRVEAMFRAADERAARAAAGETAQGAEPATTRPAAGDHEAYSKRTARLYAEVDAVLVSKWDDWDQYVLEFIRRYELDPDQVRQCERILAESQERRDGYLKRRADDLRRVKEAQPRTAGDMRLAEERLNLLLRPVNQTFERMKSRLETIPTRKQREEARAAEERKRAAPEQAGESKGATGDATSRPLGNHDTV